jgi:eukaryotic-like serine/threonine-protein kinase
MLSDPTGASALPATHTRLKQGEQPTSSSHAHSGAENLPQTLSHAGGDAALHKAADTMRPAIESDFRLPLVPGYEILARVGQGGCGVVYKARDARLRRIVALKMLRAPDLQEPGLYERFRAEAEAVARLQHPNIVPLYEVMLAPDGPYFALEYLEAGDLASLIAGRPQPAKQAARLVETLARAVHFAHERGIMHRDLKPANILLKYEASAIASADAAVEPPLSGMVPKIGDFGIAKEMVGKSHLTRTGEILGTPGYMAPEQAAGCASDQGPGLDIYSLGAILYELLTGRAPFVAPTAVETLLLVRNQDPVPPRRLQPNVPIDLETICLKCLQKAPAQRYATALELAQDLERFDRGEPISARPIGLWGRTRKWIRRKPAAAALVCVATLAAAVLFCVSLGYNAVLQQEIDETARQRRQALEAQDLAERRGRDLEARQTALELAMAAEKKSKAEAEKRGQELAQANVAEKAIRASEEAARKLAEQRESEGQQMIDAILARVGDINQAQLPEMEKLRRALLEDALAFYQRMLKAPGDNPKVRRDAANATYRIAKIQHYLGDIPAADKAYTQAISLNSQLAADDPANAANRVALATCHDDMAVLLTYHGRVPDAMAHSRTAQRLWQELLDASPADLAAARRLAAAHLQHAVQLTFAGQPREAERFYLESKKLYEKVLTAAPADDASRMSYAHLLSTLCIDLYYRGDLVGAEQSGRKAVEIETELLGKQPDRARYRQHLARSYTNLAVTLSATQRSQEGAELSRKAVDLLQKLCEECPSMPEYTNELARAWNNLGIALMSQRKTDAGEEAYQKVIELRRKLVEKHGTAPDMTAELGAALSNLATCRHARKDYAAAVKLTAEAVELQLTALKTNPKHPIYTSFLANHYANLARYHLDQADHAAAAVYCAKFSELPDRKAQDQRSCANMVVEAIRLAGADDRLSDDQRAEVEEGYGKQAVATLRLAIQAGLAMPAALATDAALAPIAARDDFRKLLEEREPH